MNNQVRHRVKENTLQHEQLGLRLFLRLIPIMVLLLCFLLLRLVNIAEFPFFVDETRHIGRARIIWSFSDLHVSTTPGKFFLYYWMGAFGIPANAAQWLSRTSVVIFSMLGAAGTFALARLWFSWGYGLLALAILSVFPFMLFYERLALSDPMTASLVILATWWSVVVILRPTHRRSLILGLLLALMMMGKILAAPLLILPIMAIVLVGPYSSHILALHWREMPNQVFVLIKDTYRPFLTRIFAIWGAIWGFLMMFYLLRGIIDPDSVRPIVDGYLYRGLEANLGLNQQESNLLAVNIERIVQGMFYMWKPLLLIVLAISIPALWRQQKQILIFLLSLIVGMWIPLVVVAGRLSTRYLTLVGHLCVVLVVGGIWALQRELKLQAVEQRIPRYVVWLPILAIGIWIAGSGIPFWKTLVDDPTALALPERDQHEYFRNQTGYAIQDILETVEILPPISLDVDVPVIVGMVRNCQYLPYHTEPNRHYRLACPKIGHDAPYQPHIDLNIMLAQYEALYVMVEEFDLEPNSQEILHWCLIEGEPQLITTYQRPFDGVSVSLYQVKSVSFLDKFSSCGTEWMRLWLASAYRVGSN